MLYPKRIEDPTSRELIQQGLADENIQAFRQLSDDLTHVIPIEIPQYYMDKAKRIATNWNILVQVRVYYMEMFKQPEILSQIGLEKIQYLIHLDGDLLVIRNIFDLIRDIESSGCDWCIASAPYDELHDENKEKVYAEEEEDEYEYEEDESGISGGVVVFNLNKSVNVDNCIEKEIRYNTGEYAIRNTIDGELLLAFRLFSPVAWDAIEQLTIKTLEAPSVNGDDDRSKIIQCFDKLKESFPSLFENDETLDELKKRLCEISHNISMNLQEYASTLEELLQPNKCSEILNSNKKYNEKEVSNPTEEAIFWNFRPKYWFGSQYNFNPKYIFPELNESGGRFWGILNDDQSTAKKKYTLRQSIFRKLHVFHFDRCSKPWSLTYSILAKINPELYKITFIYYRYIQQMKAQGLSFADIDEWYSRLENYLSEYMDVSYLEPMSTLQIFESINFKNIIKKHCYDREDEGTYKALILAHCQKSLEAILGTTLIAEEIGNFLDARAKAKDPEENSPYKALYYFDNVLELSQEALAQEFKAWRKNTINADESAKGPHSDLTESE